MSTRGTLVALLLLVIITTGLGALIELGDSEPESGGPVSIDEVAAAATAAPTPHPVVLGADEASAGAIAQFSEDPHLAPFVPDSRALVWYRRGVALRDAGEPQAAMLSLGLAAIRDGPIGGMARLRLGQLLAEFDRGDEAVGVLELVATDDDLTEAVQRLARSESARILEAGGRPAEAIPLFEAVALDPAAGIEEAAAARASLARLRRAEDDPAWVDDALAAVAMAPGLPPALEALDALEAAQVPVPLLDAAYTRYRAFQNAEATAYYEEVVATGSPQEAAVAWFYLGALAEREFADDLAIDAYTESLAADSSGRLASDAHWWRGRLLEQAGALTEATADYRAVALEFPDSPFAPEAALRAAVILADRGAEPLAAAQLRALAAGGLPADGAMALRWLRVLGLNSEGDDSPGSRAPASIWALLDGAGEQAGAALPEGALTEGLPLTAQAEDWAAAEAWLNSTFGVAPASGGGAALFADPGLALGLALAAAGEAGGGRAALLGLVSEFGHDPHTLYQLARVADAAELYDVALRAASGVLAHLDPEELPTAHPAVLRLAYPAPFASDVEAAAQESRIPPLLLLALVRQESAFDPQAGSIAAAYGLTQVIEPTGEQIAAELGEPWPVDLFDPTVSLRFGAHYLGRQLEAFDGDIFAALAAYNGGASNAQRWRDAQVFPGTDGYLYAIDFAETRRYLEHVAENYAWYRFLYGGTDTLGLR